jgi:hypothetical protein
MAEEEKEPLIESLGENDLDRTEITVVQWDDSKIYWDLSELE